MDADATHRYEPTAFGSYRCEQLENLMIRMIDKDTPASGMRLSSVRAMTEEHGLSLSTMMQA